VCLDETSRYLLAGVTPPHPLAPAVATTGYFDLVESNRAFVGGKGDFYRAASHWLQSDEPQVKEYPTVILSGATVDNRRFFPLSQAGTLIPVPTPGRPGR
jgi:hypothetical protein